MSDVLLLINYTEHNIYSFYNMSFIIIYYGEILFVFYIKILLCVKYYFNLEPLLNLDANAKGLFCFILFFYRS